MTVTILTVSAILVGAAAARHWIEPRRAPGAGRAVRVRLLARFSVVPRGTRRPPGDDDVAEWCEHVARGVRAGSSLGHALVQAGAIAPAGGAGFEPVVRAIGRGLGLADALGDLHDHDPASSTGLVVPVLAACAELGGPAALPLERVAATLHARAAERAERRTNSAQARLSARVLTTVPLGTLALLAVAEPAVRASLTSELGVVCLVLGGLLNVAGWYWMRHLVRGAA
jgi:tight adherence protein B